MIIGTVHAPLVRYECPVAACPWLHIHPAVSDELGGSEEIAAAMSRAFAAVEEVIRAHLETHSLLEWVTEIRRLREVIDLAAIALGDQGQIGTFIRAAAAPGSPVETSRRELLARLAVVPERLGK